MKKNFFILFIFFIPQILFAAQAVVIPLETPIFSLNSKISKTIGHLRKGHIVYVHDKYLQKRVSENFFKL